MVLVSPKDGSTQTSLVTFTWEVIDKSSENPTSVLHIVDVATSSDKEYIFKGSGKISTSLVLSPGEYEWFVEAFNGFASTKTLEWGFTVEKGEYLLWKDIPVQNATEGEDFALNLNEYILTSSPSSVMFFLQNGVGTIDDNVYKFSPDYDASGIYTNTILAKLEDIQKATSFVIVVYNKDRSPQEVLLIYPDSGSTDVEPDPTFSWKAEDPDLDDFLSYVIYIKSSNDPYWKEFISTNSSTLRLKDFLDYKKQYSWRVKACDSYGLCRESDESTFLVTDKGYVYLVATETNLSSDDETDVEVFMDNFYNIIGYEIHIMVSSNVYIRSADFYCDSSCMEISDYSSTEAFISCASSEGFDKARERIMKLKVKLNKGNKGQVYVYSADIIKNEDDYPYYPVKIGKSIYIKK